MLIKHLDRPFRLPSCPAYPGDTVSASAVRASTIMSRLSRSFERYRGNGKLNAKQRKIVVLGGCPLGRSRAKQREDCLELSGSALWTLAPPHRCPAAGGSEKPLSHAPHQGNGRLDNGPTSPRPARKLDRLCLKEAQRGDAPSLRAPAPRLVQGHVVSSAASCKRD